MNSRRTLTAVILVLATLAGSPGALLAACGDCHPCCRPPAVPMIGASCCPTLQAAAPEETLPAAVPPAPTVLIAAAAVEISEETVAWVATEPLPESPPLHAGIGLYTLHATFLI